MAADSHYMQMLSEIDETSSADEFGIYLSPELSVTTVPRGRSAGLFGALALAVCNLDRVRELPDVAVEVLGVEQCMFDYDPAAAVALDLPYA